MARGNGLATAAYSADIFSVPDGIVRDGSLVISCCGQHARTDRREPLGRADAMPAAENQYRAAVRLRLGACIPACCAATACAECQLSDRHYAHQTAPAQLRCGDVSAAHGRLTHTGRGGRRTVIAGRTRHPLRQPGRRRLVWLGNAARPAHSPRDSVATRALRAVPLGPRHALAQRVSTAGIAGGTATGTTGAAAIPAAGVRRAVRIRSRGDTVVQLRPLPASRAHHALVRRPDGPRWMPAPPAATRSGRSRSGLAGRPLVGNCTTCGTCRWSVWGVAPGAVIRVTAGGHVRTFRGGRTATTQNAIPPLRRANRHEQ